MKNIFHWKGNIDLSGLVLIKTIIGVLAAKENGDGFPTYFSVTVFHTPEPYFMIVDK